MNHQSRYQIIFILVFNLILGCSVKKEDQNVQKSTKALKGSQEITPERRGAQKKIIVYGSMECSHCQEFKRKLDNKGIEYEFRDVDASDVFYMELQDKIKSIGFQGDVEFPVLDIEGEILVKPEFKEARRKMYIEPEN